jgi:hypothetical protein
MSRHPHINPRPDHGSLIDLAGTTLPAESWTTIRDTCDPILLESSDYATYDMNPVTGAYTIGHSISLEGSECGTSGDPAHTQPARCEDDIATLLRSWLAHNGTSDTMIDTGSRKDRVLVARESPRAPALHTYFFWGVKKSDFMYLHQYLTHTSRIIYLRSYTSCLSDSIFRTELPHPSPSELPPL